MEAVPPIVTLHVWRISSASVPRALVRLSMDRSRGRRTAGVRFAKMLGTGSSFGVTEADPTRWARLACWTDEGPDPVAAAWDSFAVERCLLTLRPLSSVGRWSGREPFGHPVATGHTGPVCALTRARLKPRRARSFWQAVPPVEAALHGSPGLRASLAVGEAPVGLQGTFSVWDDSAALHAFAYDGAAHQQAMRDTTRLGWYAESLFARFALTASEGTLDGRVLA